MGRLTSVLKPVADRYNNLEQNDRYQYRRKVRSLCRWYGYMAQVIRMFDKELHEENLFCRYLLGLLPAESVENFDLEGKQNLNIINWRILLKAQFNWKK